MQSYKKQNFKGQNKKKLRHKEDTKKKKIHIGHNDPDLVFYLFLYLNVLS